MEDAVAVEFEGYGLRTVGCVGVEWSHFPSPRAVSLTIFTLTIRELRNVGFGKLSSFDGLCGNKFSVCRSRLGKSVA